MPVATGGKGVRLPEESKRKKNNNGNNFVVSKIPVSVVQGDSSIDSNCSSNCSSAGEKREVMIPKRRVRPLSFPKREKVAGQRCDWITPHSEPLYASFHDEEWGVPVHDDRKLFELLVLSIALAEFPWTTILNNRDLFRKVFDNFEPSHVAKLIENEMVLLISNGRTLLSEPKIRAIVENASHITKIQQEFSSFSNYLWSFVNHKPIRNGFRYGRQVPVKTPKSELISKDLMQRGFRCVGPSVVYSFMQVAGLVNDHLINCYRYEEINDNNVIKDTKPNNAETGAID